MNENALVIIHAQNTYIGDRTHLKAAADNIAHLTQQRPSGVGHVVHVLTIDAPDGAVTTGKKFSALTDGHEGISPLHRGIQIRPEDLVILTPARDANLFNVPGAIEALHERGISNIAFTGFSTRQCVAASVSGGAQNGFNLSIVADATGSSAFSGGGRSGPANPSNTALGLQELNDNFGAGIIIGAQLNTPEWKPNEISKAYVELLKRRDALAGRYVKVMDETRYSGATQKRLEVAREMVAAGFNKRDFYHMFQSNEVGEIAANDFRIAEGGEAAIGSYLQREAQPTQAAPVRQQATVDREQLKISLDEDRKRILRDGSLDHIWEYPDKPLDTASAEMLQANIRSIEPKYLPLKAYYDNIAEKISAGVKPSNIRDAFSEPRKAEEFLVQLPSVVENIVPAPTKQAGGGAHPQSYEGGSAPANPSATSNINQLAVAPQSIAQTGNTSAASAIDSGSGTKTTEIHTPEIYAPDVHGRSGVLFAAGMGLAVTGGSLLNGASVSQAATAGVNTIIDGAVPGASDGFEGITHAKGWVETALNAADTATGTLATGAAVVAGGAFTTAAVTSPLALTGAGAAVPAGALTTAAGAETVAFVAGAANMIVGFTKDAAYSAGLSNTAGPIHGVIELGKSYVNGFGGKIWSERKSPALPDPSDLLRRAAANPPIASLKTPTEPVTTMPAAIGNTRQSPVIVASTQRSLKRSAGFTM